MFANAIFSLPILAFAAGVSAKSASMTPHDKYSSSVGVLGCKIDTNRVAYWPGSIDCNNICLKVSHEGRSVHLLRIDQSQGAYDISYDAWAYLQTGDSASDNPVTGGGVDMEYEEVDADECADLIKTKSGGLPLSASNSINYLVSCLDEPDSWVAKNHVLYNICDPICTLGHDEECELDLATSNQPSCKNTLGLTTELTSAPVYNIMYETGETERAGGGPVVPVDGSSGGDDSSSGDDDTAPSSPAAQPSPSTPAAQTSTTVDGVFHEVPSSPTPAQPEETADVPAEGAVPAEETTTAPAPVEETTTAAAQPTEPPVVEESSTFATPVVSTAVTVITSSSAGNETVHTSTLSTVTYSTGEPAEPSASTTEVPASAGSQGASVSFLLVVSSMIVCALMGAI